jgi:hypothetical protein
MVDVASNAATLISPAHVIALPPLFISDSRPRSLSAANALRSLLLEESSMGIMSNCALSR